MGALMLAIGIVCLVMPLSAQTNAGAKPAAKAWTPPRGPDGHPDISGVWSHNSATPFERPDELAGREFLTPEEVANLKRNAAELFNGDTDAAFGDSVFLAALRKTNGFTSTDTTGNYNHFWLVDREFDNRTSLISDPKDGKQPALTATAQQQQSARAEYLKQHPFDGPEDIALGERCITGTVPMYGAGYNNYYEIVQHPNYVAINMEMRHDMRMIPIGSKPHVASPVQLWLGDPRGRWEGDTLVIDSTNFRQREFGAAGAIRTGGLSEKARVTERISRVGPETLKYEVTINDPGTYTKPWSTVMFLQKSKDQVYEYACHEGNEAMSGTLGGERVKDRKAAAAKTSSKQ
jgi:hypothetical protein